MSDNKTDRFSPKWCGRKSGLCTFALDRECPGCLSLAQSDIGSCSGTLEERRKHSAKH